MATVTGHRLLADASASSLANDLLDMLDAPNTFLAVAGDARAEPVPGQVSDLIHRVLEAVASGCTVTIAATPDELTTTAAAAMIGVSRPTLMKMIHAGRIPAHKVGTHTRLRTSDVLDFVERRQAVQRVAFAELRELLD